jgi:hypothetical protein
MPMRMRVLSRRRLFAGLLLACLGVACAGGLVVAQVTAPRVFRTHRDTVADALERRGIQYTEILFVQSIEDRNNLLFYHANVRVFLPDGGVVNGWIGCEERDSGCLLDLDPLDIKGAPLPELTPARPYPWIASIERMVEDTYDLMTP